MITRLQLFDSYLVYFCTSPSMASGSRRRGSTISAIFIGIRTNGNRRTASTRPIWIPVHLAHSGNWYDPRKKLLSGIWWQRANFPQNSIHSTQRLSRLVATASGIVCFISRTSASIISNPGPYALNLCPQLWQIQKFLVVVFLPSPQKPQIRPNQLWKTMAPQQPLPTE